MPGFYWRLSFYLVLDILILWHYKERMFDALKSITTGLTTKYKYPIWAYLALPIMAIILEIIGFLPKLITEFILNPTETIHALSQMPRLLLDVVHRFFN